MSYLIPRAGHDGVGLDYRVVYNKGGDNPVEKFIEDTGNSLKDIADNTSSSVDQFAKDTGSSWKDVLQNDSTGLLKPATTAIASYFGGPWAAAAMSGANSRATGSDWGTSVANAGMSYAASDYARDNGFGYKGDTDTSLVKVYDGGTPGVSEVGGSMQAPDVQQGTLDGLGGMSGYGGMDTAAGASGASTVDVSTQPSIFDEWGGVANPQQGAGTIDPSLGVESQPSWFNQATGQAPAPVETPTPQIINNGQMGPATPTNTGTNLGDYTLKGLMGKTGMNSLVGGLRVANGVGGLYNAYQAQQRQGQLQDLYNQQKQVYDSQLGQYTNFNNQIQNLQTNPSEYFNTPEWQAQNSSFLANLARKDAASGRRSQYGARAGQMQNNFLQGVNAKTQALTQARGAAPNSTGMNQALGYQLANENAMGQGLAQGAFGLGSLFF